jgi:hypothetical protein
MTELSKELETDAADEGFRATRAYIISQSFLILALGCSVAASVCGVVFQLSPRLVGILAAIPPVVAYIATAYRFSARESWYYRKSVALNALRSRLMYQLPEEPTVDNVAAIAAARDKLESGMQREWHDTITMGIFDSFDRQNARNRADRSSDDQGSGS